MCAQIFLNIRTYDKKKNSWNGRVSIPFATVARQETHKQGMKVKVLCPVDCPLLIGTERCKVHGEAFNYHGIQLLIDFSSMQWHDKVI